MVEFFTAHTSIRPYVHPPIRPYAHTPPPQPPSNHDRQQQNPCTWHPPHRSRIGATALSSEKRLSCNLIRQEAMEVHRTGQHFLNERRTQVAESASRAHKRSAARIGLSRRAASARRLQNTRLRLPIRSHTSRNRSHLRRSSTCTPATRPLPPNRGSREGDASPSESEAARLNAVRIRSSGRAPIRARPSPQRPPNSLRAAAALRHHCLQPRRTRTRAPAARC